MCYNKLKIFPPHHNKSFFTYVTHNRNYDMISKMLSKMVVKNVIIYIRSLSIRIIDNSKMVLKK